MNTLLYLQLGLAALVAAAGLFLLVKAIRRKQKHRIFELSVSVLALAYLVVDKAFPIVEASAPGTMEWILVTLSLLFVIDLAVNGAVYYK